MASRPYISFYIPTYNRSNCLRDSVLSLVTQPSFDPDSMEIIICDDASTDNTAEVIAELQKQYPSIHYLHNAKNLWIDRNIYRAFSVCTWKYIWLMGDDDAFYPNSIAKVLESIHTYPDAYVFHMNMDHFDKDMTICTKKDLLEAPNTMSFSCLADLYEHGHYHMGIITYMWLVFRNNLGDIPDIEIPETYFPQSCIRSLLHDKQMIIVWGSIIKYRTNHSDFATAHTWKGIQNHWKIWMIGYIKFVWFCYKHQSAVNYKRLMRVYIFVIKRFITLLCVLVVRKLGLYEKVLPRWRKSIFNIYR